MSFKKVQLTQKAEYEITQLSYCIYLRIFVCFQVGMIVVDFPMYGIVLVQGNAEYV